MTNTINTTSASTSVKLTQRDHFNALLALADVQARPDLVEFINGRLAQLDKKSASASGAKKPTARQLENAKLKEAIIDNMAPNQLYTIGEMLKSFNCFEEDMTAQRLSAIIAQMVKVDGTVIRTEDKRKAYFSLATVSAEEDIDE